MTRNELYQATLSQYRELLVAIPGHELRESANDYSLCCKHYVPVAVLRESLARAMTLQDCPSQAAPDSAYVAESRANY